MLVVRIFSEPFVPYMSVIYVSHVMRTVQTLCVPVLMHTIILHLIHDINVYGKLLNAYLHA